MVSAQITASLKDNFCYMQVQAFDLGAEAFYGQQVCTSCDWLLFEAIESKSPVRENSVIYLHGGDFQWGRQVRDNCVQEGLHPLILEGAAAEDGHKRVANAALANQPLQGLHARLLSLLEVSTIW